MRHLGMTARVGQPSHFGMAQVARSTSALAALAPAALAVLPREKTGDKSIFVPHL